MGGDRRDGPRVETGPKVEGLLPDVQNHVQEDTWTEHLVSQWPHPENFLLPVLFLNI